MISVAGLVIEAVGVFVQQVVKDRYKPSSIDMMVASAFWTLLASLIYCRLLVI